MTKGFLFYQPINDLKTHLCKRSYTPHSKPRALHRIERVSYLSCSSWHLLNSYLNIDEWN